MGRRLAGLIQVFSLLFCILLSPEITHSGPVVINFGQTQPVTITKATIVDVSENEMKLAGQIYRAHRVPMVGHLHVYAYSEDGGLIFDSKHQVVGLNSQRRGAMRLPFKITIDCLSDKCERVDLKYHSPGC